MLERFTNLYPLWIVVSSVVGFLYPPVLAWFAGPWVIGALTAVMLGMGLTLTVDDFRRLGSMPGAFTLGFLAQYTIMPLCGWGIATLLQLEQGFMVGLILVACCPGGTASNLIAYLARANVALSVVLTMCSTLLAFIMTPLWCEGLIGQHVPVDAWGMCRSTLQVIVAPVLLGVFCNWRFPRMVAVVSPYGPVVSVVAIIFIAGGIVAQSADEVAAHAGRLALASLLLHVTGYGVGYAIPRLLRYPQLVARTVSIEVGMQNCGMAVMLSKRHFAMEPLAAVPSVFSSVLQTVVGSLIAARWRARPPLDEPGMPAQRPATAVATDTGSAP